MDKNKLWKWLLLGLLAIWSITLVTPIDQKVRLGLDIMGVKIFVVVVVAYAVAKTRVAGGEAATVV
jgi:hypothetical protein